MPQPEHLTTSEAYLFWRDEILQVMYWMLGEGLGQEVGPSSLKTFLGSDEQQLVLLARLQHPAIPTLGAAPKSIERIT